MSRDMVHNTSQPQGDQTSQTRWPRRRRRTARRMLLRCTANDAGISHPPEVLGHFEDHALVLGREVLPEVEEFLDLAVFDGVGDLVDDAAFGEAGGLVFAEGILGPAEQVLRAHAKNLRQAFNDFDRGVCDTASFQLADVGAAYASGVRKGVLKHAQVAPRYQKAMSQSVTHDYIFGHQLASSRRWKRMSFWPTLLLDKRNTA